MPYSDAAPRRYTRLLLMYNLIPQIQVQHDLLRPLTDAFHLGRFSAHIESAGRLLPQVIFYDDVSALIVPWGQFVFPGQFQKVRVIVAVTPRWDPLLFLDVELDDVSVPEIAETLYATWQGRRAMRIGEALLTDWLAEQLGRRGLACPASLGFGRNVHQSVFPGSSVARELLSEHVAETVVTPEIKSIVLRGTLDGSSGASLGIRRPESLNNPGQTMVAHGRGVSLIVGWTPAVENAFGLAAAGIVNAVSAVHRIRLEAFEALEFDREAIISSASDARLHVDQLSRRLSDLQLDLSFSVEVYADTILIPELLVESFHSSLRNVAALADGLANTSRIVQRVEAVLATRRVMLETAFQEYGERRDRIIASVIAVLSVLALPPALLLSFFGVNSNDVNSKVSIFDMHRYALAYALAWLPFLSLIVIGVIARRRIRLRVFDYHHAERPARPRQRPRNSQGSPGRRGPGGLRDDADAERHRGP